MDKTIAIIPARGGSKRLPGKNTMLLGGLPLIAHSIAFAQEHPAIIDAIYVSTDDPQIKAVALQFGALVIDRPAALATDCEPTVSTLKHVLEQIGPVENVVLLQPTNPLRPAGLLIEAFDIFNRGNYNSLFTVTRNEQKLGKIVDNRFVPFNYAIGQRSQDLEPLFFENGLLYIAKSLNILQDKIIDQNAFPMIVNHIFANVDIDTQEDFDYVHYLLTHSNP